MIYLLEIEGHHYRFPFWIRFIEIDELRDLKYKQPSNISWEYLWFLRLVYQPRVMRFNNSSFHSVVKKCIQQDVIICKVRYK